MSAALAQHFYVNIICEDMYPGKYSNEMGTEQMLECLWDVVNGVVRVFIADPFILPSCSFNNLG